MIGDRVARPLRVVRGVVLGLCVLAISIAGHAAGGQGTLPDVVSFLILLPLAVSLSVTMSGRRRGGAWLLGYLLGVQALFHVLLTLSTSHVGHHQSFTPTVSMLALHVLATLACAVVLTSGDRHLMAWLRLLSSLGRHYEMPTSAPAGITVVVAAEDQTPRIRRVSAHPYQHRGPPALSF
jgi:hypothetical protein